MFGHTSCFVGRSVLMHDRRIEPRTPLQLPIRIWGLDAKGSPYTQSAVASSISFNGALVSGIQIRLRPGDLIGIQHQDKQARYRVVWARDSGGEQKNQAAVQRIEGCECPWSELLPHAAEAAAR